MKGMRYLKNNAYLCTAFLEYYAKVWSCTSIQVTILVNGRTFVVVSDIEGGFVRFVLLTIDILIVR